VRDFLNGEVAIYPGHPLTIAYLIVNAYPSLVAAIRKSDQTTYPDALSNGNIPGAGGNVLVALDFLRKAVIEHAPINDVIDHANSFWANCDSQAKGGGAKIHL
jgi:hypothetical protein